MHCIRPDLVLNIVQAQSRNISCSRHAMPHQDHCHPMSLSPLSLSIAGADGRTCSASGTGGAGSSSQQAPSNSSTNGASLSTHSQQLLRLMSASSHRPFSARPGTGSGGQPGTGSAGSAPSSASAAGGGLYWRKNRLGSCGRADGGGSAGGMLLDGLEGGGADGRSQAVRCAKLWFARMHFWCLFAF